MNSQQMFYLTMAILSVVMVIALYPAIKNRFNKKLKWI